MIVDDDIVIIGSANLNDRSMAGDRDSEIAAIISDHEKIPSKMNNKTVKVSKFSSELRKALWMEHLGCNYDEVIDPLSKKT